MRSPYGLLQEDLQRDPWKIFVCCIFCNLTRRVQAEPFFWKVISKWPSAKELSEAKNGDLKELISSLGLTERRTKALKKMSYDYLHKDWKNDPKSLYGIGKYGSDAYYIFCTDKWREIQPKDGALVKYHNWKMSLNPL